MSSQAFLWLNLGFVGLMGLLFYLGRARIKDPTQLKLRSGLRSGPRSGFGTGRSVTPSAGLGLSDELSAEADEAIRRSAGADMKSLNVIFMYNGHSFDAYEVLGVPAGANSEMVKSAYSRALRAAEGDSRAFIESAYRAIATKAG